MDPYFSTGRALRMPELLASILQWLGPVDWLPCSVVCSWWSFALVDRGATIPPEGDEPATGTKNLWRDFAETTMCYEHDPSQDGGGRNASCRRSPYRAVCLDGNPTLLGPPVRVVGDGHVAIVKLKEVVDASLARSRKPRALVKFLLLWASYGTIIPTAAGDARRARVSICDDFIRFVYPRNFGLPGATNSRDAVTPAVGSAAHRAARKTARRRSKSLPSVLTTIAMINDGMCVFTRLLVLCRRCRSPRTTLCASDHRGMPVLSVECQEARCGLTSRVCVNRKRSPQWLTKFAEYVLHRTWEGINTFEADHGAEWFSDTSPEAVQRRQEEARAESLGLDALATKNSKQESE